MVPAKQLKLEQAEAWGRIEPSIATSS